jgi:sugar/nucleoside kinase (ribokinase family)
MAPRLLCVGDLNLDLVITPEHGIAVGSDSAGVVSMAGGGSAANVAAWAAAGGIEVRFVGTVGDDATGTFLVGELAGRGVDVRPIVRADARTRTIAVIVGDDGDRSMVSDLDERVALRDDDFDSDWFDGVDWLHLTGYTYVDAMSRPLFARLLDDATRRGIRCSIDPSAAELLRTRCQLEAVRAAFSGAEVLFPSRDEAHYLTGIDDPAAAASALLDVAHTVAVTCGSDGVYVASPGEPVRHTPAADVDVVNALGAGDAFAAGFLTGVLLGHDPVANAIATSAQAVSRPTAR